MGQSSREAYREFSAASSRFAQEVRTIGVGIRPANIQEIQVGMNVEQAVDGGDMFPIEPCCCTVQQDPCVLDYIYNY